MKNLHKKQKLHHCSIEDNVQHTLISARFNLEKEQL